MAAEYEEDARYKRLMALIDVLERKLRRPYTHELRQEDERLITQARKDLRSIGVQMNRNYHEQMPLLGDVPPRKAVQQR